MVLLETGRIWLGVQGPAAGGHPRRAGGDGALHGRGLRGVHAGQQDPAHGQRSALRARAPPISGELVHDSEALQRRHDQVPHLPLGLQRRGVHCLGGVHATQGELSCTDDVDVDDDGRWQMSCSILSCLPLLQPFITTITITITHLTHCIAINTNNTMQYNTRHGAPLHRCRPS